MEIYLSKLLNRQGFHINSQLVYNRLSFLTTTLADTRANRYLFINIKKAIKLACFHNISTNLLENIIEIKEFNKAAGPQITHTIKLHLIIGGQQYLNQPFLILNLGQHKVIIG